MKWAAPVTDELDRPKPLISAEVDLRSYPYMPLLIWRLRDSEFMQKATREEIACAFLLWCQAWREKPTGSLPNDDRLLQTCCKFAADRRQLAAWLQRKCMALWNFVLCSDNRFYHPVICEQAEKAWEYKKKQIVRTEAARNAKLKKNLCNSSVTENTKSLLQDPIYNYNYNKKEKRARARAQGDGASRLPAAQLEFEEFWKAYPHKVGKGAARKAFQVAADKATMTLVIEAISRYKKTKPKDRPWCNPSTWLNQERWLDEEGAQQMSHAAHAARPETRRIKHLLPNVNLTEDERTKRAGILREVEAEIRAASEKTQR